MSALIKYTLEFPINSSINILYLRLSSPSGLAEWFADDIIIKAMQLVKNTLLKLNF